MIACRALMKALIQRVSSGSVEVAGGRSSCIGPGFVILVGVKSGDTDKDSEYLARKTLGLRILPDSQDLMNLSIMDTGGEALVISQFTLYAGTRKGNRPSFIDAAEPTAARMLYEDYVDRLRSAMGADRVKTGVFGARMSVCIVNDGPVTVELRSEEAC